MNHQPTFDRLKDETYQLYTLLRDDRWFPETLAILGRESLLVGSILTELLPVSYIKYGEAPEDIPWQKPVGKTLIFTLQATLGFSQKAKEVMLGRIFKISCIYNHQDDGVHYSAILTPERLEICLPSIF